MTNKDKQLLEHIIKYCNRVRDDIERFGNDYKDFISDPAFRDSVSMNILQIGGLSNKLSDEFKQSTTKDIPWKRIYDMRNHFAHGYRGIGLRNGRYNTHGCLGRHFIYAGRR